MAYNSAMTFPADLVKILADFFITYLAQIMVVVKIRVLALCACEQLFLIYPGVKSGVYIFLQYLVYEMNCIVSVFWHSQDHIYLCTIT